jgi:hypothetical protein
MLINLLIERGRDTIRQHAAKFINNQSESVVVEIQLLLCYRTIYIFNEMPNHS